MAPRRSSRGLCPAPVVRLRPLTFSSLFPPGQGTTRVPDLFLCVSDSVSPVYLIHNFLPGTSKKLDISGRNTVECQTHRTYPPSPHPNTNTRPHHHRRPEAPRQPAQIYTDVSSQTQLDPTNRAHHEAGNEPDVREPRELCALQGNPLRHERNRADPCPLFREGGGGRIPS